MPASTPLSSTDSSTQSPVSTQASVTPLAVSPSEACRLLSLSTSRLYQLMRAGELPSYRDGRARRITMTAIQSYIARRVADAGNGWSAWRPKPQAQASKARKRA